MDEEQIDELGSVVGVEHPTDEPGTKTKLTAYREAYEGDTDYYLVAEVQEPNGGFSNTIRIDLNRDGWFALSQLAADVAAQMPE
jgi:hypothetical protein